MPGWGGVKSLQRWHNFYHRTLGLRPVSQSVSEQSKYKREMNSAAAQNMSQSVNDLIKEVFPAAATNVTTWRGWEGVCTLAYEARWDNNDLSIYLSIFEDKKNCFKAKQTPQLRYTAKYKELSLADSSVKGLNVTDVHLCVVLHSSCKWCKGADLHVSVWSCKRKKALKPVLKVCW